MKIFPRDYIYVLDEIYHRVVDNMGGGESSSTQQQTVVAVVSHSNQSLSPLATLRTFIAVLRTARKTGAIEAASLGCAIATTPSRQRGDGKEKREKEGGGREAISRPCLVPLNGNDKLQHEDGLVSIPDLIRCALVHDNEEIRIDALDLIVVGKKTAEVPTLLEMGIVSMIYYYITFS